MLIRELPQGGQAHHGSVVVHQLGDHANRRAAGQPRQFDGGLGVSTAGTHPAVVGTQRKDVSGPVQVAGQGRGSASTLEVSARSAALMPVLVPDAASQDTV